MRKRDWVIVGLLVISCSSPNTRVAGTISETDTGCAVAGLIQHVDSSPVVHANVILHDQRSVMRISLPKQAAFIRSGSTQTNINGFFRFDSVDTGGYLVEINDHDTLGAVLPARVNPPDTLVVVDGTLGRLGTIIGRVDVSKYGGSGAATILVPEIGRSVAVDTAGYFEIDGVPAWNYHVTLAIGDSAVALPSDTLSVPVVEGDTTRITSLGAPTGTVVITGNVVE